jgi:hypothetical protein
MSYTPRPIDTEEVKLTEELEELKELLAENAHDNWAIRKMSEHWTCGPPNDALRKHPDLIPYKDLPEEKKEYDRDMAMKTLKAIIALGYKIEKRK